MPRGFDLKVAPDAVRMRSTCVRYLRQPLAGDRNFSLPYVEPQYTITIPTPPPICPHHIPVTCASKVTASV